MSDDVVIAQTTSDDEDQAKALAKGAVESGLAAGVHIDAPITAVYRWRGKVETAQEWRISYLTLLSLKGGDSYGSRRETSCFVADCPPGELR